MHPLKIRLLPSGNGDCILISSETSFFLFDGGTASSYKEWKNEIVTLPKIDGLFITHIDNDHISGIIKLIQENEKHAAPNLIEIGDIFYNGVEQILKDKIINDVSNQNEFLRLNAYFDTSIQEKNIGYSEGTGLSYLLKEFGYPINRGCTNGKFCRETTPGLSFSGMKIDVIGPSISVLDKMKNDWDNELQRQRISNRILNKIHAQSFEKYVSNICSDEDFTGNISYSVRKNLDALANSPYHTDDSLANRSSICLLADFSGKKIMMLGDTNCETVIDWLNNKAISCLSVDAIKISHHGSKKNINKELIKRVKTKNYIICTDGKLHKHPDMEALARIVYYSTEQEVFFHFNHQHDYLDYDLLSSMPGKTVSFNFSGVIEI